MSEEETQKVLNELQSVRPEMLNGEAKRLFEAIMKIADKKDELYKKVDEQNKIIDLMSEDIYKYQIECDRFFRDKEEVKQYFERKVEGK